MAKTKTGNITELKQDDRNANRPKAKGKELGLTKVSIGSIELDSKNANKSNDEGHRLIKKSLEELGAARSIVIDKNGVVVAGNQTLKMAREAGFENIIVVQTTGNELVAVQRTDIEIDSQKGRQLAIADNSTSEVSLNWDYQAIQEIEEQWGFEAVEWGVELPTFVEEPSYEELIGENKEKPPTMKVTFPTPEDLQKCESHIQEVLNRICPNAYYSISAGEA